MGVAARPVQPVVVGRHLWIAAACRDAGLRVVEVQGWRERGGTTFVPRGAIIHHTAGAPSGDMPSLGVLVSGRPGIPGPLSQFGVGRSGTIYVVAAGRANHAGNGGWRGLAGNAAVWGIEAENTGRGEPWPPAQLDAFHRLAAVLAARTPFAPDLIACHREWAPRRKIDPTGIDGDAFRRAVAALLAQEDDDVLKPDEAADLKAVKNYAAAADEKIDRMNATLDRIALAVEQLAGRA